MTQLDYNLIVYVGFPVMYTCMSLILLIGVAYAANIARLIWSSR